MFDVCFCSFLPLSNGERDIANSGGGSDARAHWLSGNKSARGKNDNLGVHLSYKHVLPQELATTTGYPASHI